MHMQAMNNFGNRGFGGPPQPQRQGGRRGNNNRGMGGGFRTSRFDQQGNNNQRNGPNQGGQRPNEIQQQKPPLQQQKPPLQQQKPPQQATQQPQNKPQQQSTPQPVKPTTPVQPQQNKPVAPATPQNKPIQPASKPPQAAQQPPQQSPQQPKPVQAAAANANKSGPGNKEQDKANDSGNQQNGNFGGNKPSNWSHGGNKGGHVGNQGGHGGIQGGQGGNQGGHGGNQGGHVGNQGGHGGNQGGHGGNQGGHGGNQGGHGGNQGGHGGNQGGGNPRNNQSFHQKSGGGPGGPARNQMRNSNQRGPQDGLGGQKPGMREEQMLAHKLKELSGPLHELPPVEQSEVKFNGRSRLYIGNVASEASEEDVQQLFNQFGETAELFLNKDKNFGFIKLDYRVNAEKAKRELDGSVKFGRALRVRFAPHNSAIRVKNLPQFVSNELLYKSFEIFGRIEKAYVKVDERGKTLGEGVVEFQRKPAAQAAIRNCNDKCYFLTSSLRPVIVENYEEPDESDGYPEKNLPKKHPEFLRARECGPRFSESSSFEHEYGTRWKQLYDMHRQKEDALKAELQAEEEKLEAQMEFARYEHETEVLREQLRQREQDRERKKRSWELAERQADERRDTERATLMRQGDELAQRMRMQDDELRRRQQENTLFVQTQRLNALLNRGQDNEMYDGHSNQQPMDGGFREPFEMGRGYEAGMQKSHAWEGPRQVDDFPNKRRRF